MSRSLSILAIAVAAGAVGCADTQPVPPATPAGLTVQHQATAQESGGTTTRDATGRDRRDDARRGSDSSGRRAESGSSRPAGGPPTRGGGPPTHK